MSGDKDGQECRTHEERALTTAGRPALRERAAQGAVDILGQLRHAGK